MRKLIRKLDSSGDTVIEFDPEVSDEAQAKATAEAKALFERMLANGGRAFKVHRAEKQPDAPVYKFGEIENETILVPRVVGG